MSRVVSFWAAAPTRRTGLAIMLLELETEVWLGAAEDQQRRFASCLRQLLGSFLTIFSLQTISCSVI